MKTARRGRDSKNSPPTSPVVYEDGLRYRPRRSGGWGARSKQLDLAVVAPATGMWCPSSVEDPRSARSAAEQAHPASTRLCTLSTHRVVHLAWVAWPPWSTSVESKMSAFRPFSGRLVAVALHALPGAAHPSAMVLGPFGIALGQAGPIAVVVS